MKSFFLNKSITISAVLALGLCAPVLGGQSDTTLYSAGRNQIGVTTSYNPEYKSISYPNGDVPIESGVCTDVIIRAFRKMGMDLQQLVHEDMKTNFKKYPALWGLKSTDRNIDHRRVPNLQTYFKRQSWSVAITDQAKDYLPGDVVTWFLTGSSIPHIGIVSDKKTSEGVPLIIHNIGAGTQEEDCLFSYKITGHYRPKFQKK